MSSLEARSYEPVKLRFRHLEVLGQISLLGEPIPQEKETETHIILTAEMVIRGLTQGFQLRGWTNQPRFDPERLAARVKHALRIKLPSRVVCDFWETAKIRVNPSDPELIDCCEIESSLDGAIAPVLEQQARLGNAAATEWREALRKMQEMIGEHNYQRNEFEEAMAYHEMCHEAANYPGMKNWCLEKLTFIRSGLQDLARRKDTAHANYVGKVAKIRRCLHNWPVYNSWHEQPPRRNHSV